MENNDSSLLSPSPSPLASTANNGHFASPPPSLLSPVGDAVPFSTSILDTSNQAAVPVQLTHLEILSVQAQVKAQMNHYLSDISRIQIDKKTPGQLYDWDVIRDFYIEQERLGRIPLITALAQRLLSAPLSSVYSERIFSEMGQIYEEKRCRLKPNNAENLLFLHHNMQRVEELEEGRRSDKYVPPRDWVKVEDEIDYWEECVQSLNIHESPRQAPISTPPQETGDS